MKRDRTSRVGCALACGCLAAAIASCAHRPVRAEVEAPPPKPTFATKVRPILEARCVVCHACYNSPCQLNQQTYEGLDRGANKQPIYDGSRLAAIEPTRMFQDATSTREWRERLSFFPVISHGRDPTESVLHHFIAQRRADPRSGNFDADQTPTCPDSVEAAKALFAKRPEAGMPYGFPALDDAQFRIIEAWLAEGAPPPPEAPRPAAATLQALERWERFFDADDLRSQLVSRYLYEHLFLAHLHFGPPSRDFYRLVRSRTGVGQPNDEIVTVRPFDDPKVARVHYRLVRLTETIVRKTHAPFELSDQKLARFRDLFFDPKWAVTALPSYAPEVAANPFVAFAAIPARSRYQFMLDDAYYHVRAFIHGPVCKGQIALNVIDEHFWVMFLAPAADLSVTSEGFLAATAEDLRVPAEGGDGIEAIYTRFHASQLRYLKQRGDLYERAGFRGRKLADLWTGEGRNRDAILTVYRHFDSASVSRGALGATPKTAWVLDYPIFERIYYDLVAGFNVFGNVVHQISTRRYMDNLRAEAEDGYLRFLPRSERVKLRAAWYRGAGVEAYHRLIDPYFDAAVETQVRFADAAHAKEELWAQIETRALAPEVLGSSREPPPPLRALADVAGPFVALFPDLTLVRSGDQVFSFARHKAHLNVAFMFLEETYRAPDEDTLGIVRGFIGSYPNLYLEVPPGKLEQFAAQVRSLQAGDDSWSRLIDAYGVRRSSPDFWVNADWFNAHQLLEDPIEGGLLDLSRYISK
jgi:hypothetical protein